MLIQIIVLALLSQKHITMTAIINREQKFGTLNGVIKLNSEIMTLINKAIKLGTAKKLIDTPETLMYELAKYEKH